jgi:hypothetical protein
MDLKSSMGYGLKTEIGIWILKPNMEYGYKTKYWIWI